MLTGMWTGAETLSIAPISGENHDWDLTLHAAYQLLETGFVLDKRERTGTLSMGYAHFAGSMVLSFAAIESFSASIAFSMSRDANFARFDYEMYRRTFRFKDKLDQIFDAAGQPIDWSQGVFQRVKDMQDWRNSVIHSSPSAFDESAAATTSAPAKKRKKGISESYLNRTELGPAKAFYNTAREYIETLEKLTSIKPATHVVFQPKDAP